MMLMRSDMLGLHELPAAMRRGQGGSALSKFMRFQVSADTNLLRLNLFMFLAAAAAAILLIL